MEELKSAPSHRGLGMCMFGSGKERIELLRMINLGELQKSGRV